MAKEWLTYKKPNLRSSTWSVYEGHTRNNFPEFSDLKINRITIGMIEKWILDKQTQKMPIATIRKVLVMEKVNQDAPARLENAVFNDTGHKTVTIE